MSPDDPLEQARKLLVKFKHAKLFNAFDAWKGLAEFEASVSAAQEALGAYEDVLSTSPSQRSSKDIARLCTLLSKVSVYSGLPHPVQAFLAAHCRLLVIWDTQELPRTPEEAAHLYGIISGGIKCVVAEPTDPVLRCMVRQAADQLLEVDESTGAASTAPDTSASSPFKIIQNPDAPSGDAPQGASSSSVQQQRPGSKEAAAPSKAGAAGARGSTATGKRRGVRRSDTMRTYGLPAKFAVPSVQTRLWHTVVQMIHAGRVPSKREAELLLEQVTAPQQLRTQVTNTGRGHHVSLHGISSPRVSHAGGFESDPNPMRRVSMAGVERGPRMSMSGMGDSRLRMSMSGAADGPKPRMSMMGGTTMSRRTSMAGGLLGAGATHGGVALIELGPGESFSGRELDCRAESGQAESIGEFPPKVLAAMTTPNTVTSLLVISKAVYRLAMRMTSEALVQQAVSACCRFPFLRHTPLKEIYRLARHMQQSVFNKGEVLLQQGKECSNLYMVLDGEVDIVVDVPLLPPGSLKEPQLLTRAASSPRSKLTGGKVQRVLLARRGPGSVLGDDALRDKLLTVSAVVSSGSATCLWTSQSRFTMCVDPLTLRLFQRLRAQEGAWLELCTATADAASRTALLQRCKDHVLTQVLPDHTLASAKGEHELGLPRWTPPHVSDQLFSTPLSLNAGIRALSSLEETAKRAFGPAKLDWSTVLKETTKAAPDRKRADRSDEDELPSLPTGICSSWLKGIGITDSISKLHKMIARVEQERAAQRATTDVGLSKASSVGQQAGAYTGEAPVLDLREQLVQLATNRQITDHLEAACVAILKVSCLPGQLNTDCAELAPVLDDAMVEWSALAHKAQVILVRWSSTEYVVLATIEPCAQRRPAVRQVSDVVLGIYSSFNRLVATNPISHMVLHVGVAIGSTFIRQDTGRCVTSASGVAYDAAHHLCGSAQDEMPEGGILVSDAVMQAISRTHILSFSSQGYQLLRACSLPFATTHEQLLTQAVLDSEPVAAGSGQAARYHSQLDHLILNSTGPALGGALDAQLSVHFSGTEGIATLEDASWMHTKAAALDSPTRAAARSEGGVLHEAAAHGHQHHHQQGGDQAGGSVNSKGREHGRNFSNQQFHPSAAKSAFHFQSQINDEVQEPAQKRSKAVVSKSATCHLSQVKSEASMASLKAGKTALASQKEALRSMTTMQVRQQLRAELRQLGRSCPEPGDLSRIPHSTFTPSSRQTLPRQPGALGNSSPPCPASPVKQGIRVGDNLEGTGAASPGHMHSGVTPLKTSNASETTPYSPGTGPLSDLTARHRAAEVLFAGAGSCVHTAQSAVQLYSNPSTPSRTPERSSTPDISTRGAGMAGVDSLSATLNAIPSRPDSAAGRALPVVQKPAVAAAVASVAVSGMPVAPSQRRPTAAPMVLASPSLRPVAGGRPSSGHSSDSRATTPSTHVASNHGLVAVEQLLHQQGHLQVPNTVTSGPRLEEGKAQLQASKRQVDKVTGMSMATIHKQAVTAWKDMGSSRAAESYINQLPPGVLNVSFSTAGLSRLPPLNRLDHIESLAASFNTVPALTSQWLSGLCQHLHVLSLSHNCLTRLPPDFGHHLPSVTELNLSCCQLEDVPDSLAALPRLRRLSLEHNKLRQLPPSLWRLDGLEQLYLGHNHLSELPDWWGSFPVLQALHLQSNDLQELPNSLTLLGVSLISLNLSHNSLSSLPHGFLTAFSRLERLHLQYNRLCCCRQIHGQLADTCHFSLESAFSFTQRPDTATSYSSRAAELAHARTKSFAHASLASRTSVALTVKHSNPQHHEVDALPAGAAKLVSGTGGSRPGSGQHTITRAKPGSAGLGLCPSQFQGTVRDDEAGTASDIGQLERSHKTGPAKHAVIVEPMLEEELSMAGGLHRQSGMALDGAAAAGVVAASLGSLWDQLQQGGLEEDIIDNDGQAQNSLPALRYLNLAGNQLREIPSWLPGSLTYLDLTKNSIADVPVWLFDKLNSLELLALSNNQLEDLPRQITQLTSLKMLSLEHNPMTDPESKDGGMEAAAWAWEAIRSTKYQCKKESTLGGGVTAPLQGQADGPVAGDATVTRPSTSVPRTTGDTVAATRPTTSMSHAADAALVASRPSTSLSRQGGGAGDALGSSRHSIRAQPPPPVEVPTDGGSGGGAASAGPSDSSAVAKQTVASRPSSSQTQQPSKGRSGDSSPVRPGKAVVGRSPLSRVTGGGAVPDISAQPSVVSLAAGMA